MKIRPSCPNCGEGVPFAKTQFGLGKPFACAKCGEEMVIQKNFWIPLGAIVAYWRFKGYAEGWAENLGLIGLFLAIIYILTLLFMAPQPYRR